MSSYLSLSASPVRWKRVSRRQPCPVCHRPGWCEVSDDGQLVHCMRVSSERPIAWRGGGWLHQLGMRAEGGGLKGRRNEEHLTPSRIAAPSSLSQRELDRINRAFMRLCPLSDAHRRYLLAEGVPPGGCGTLYYAQAASIARQLVAQFGEEGCRRHPILKEVTSRDGRRHWWTIAAAADGLLLPASDLEGRIGGVQLRKDAPRGKDDRYRWLSSEGKGGTPLSIFRAESFNDKEPARRSHLIITEGYKKAAAASLIWGCHSISLAGVTAYKEDALLEAIEGLGVTTLSLAFDQDKREKKQVKEAETRLLRFLAACLPKVGLYRLEWEAEGGKGLDDALKHKLVADFRFVEAAPGAEQGPRLVTNLPGRVLSRTFEGVKPLYTLEQARREHRTLFDKLLRWPDGSQTVLTSTTGTGKSRAADEALADALTMGQLTHRVLLLCPNKANLAERTGPDTKLGQAVAQGLASIQRGRNLLVLGQGRPSQPEDCANPEAFEAGKARHAAAKFVCKDCPFGSAANWDKSFPGQPRSFECENNGYLASRKASRQAQVVIATKEAYLNNSHELSEFEIVVCDEELLPHLVESGILITTEVLASWREKLACKNLAAPNWQKLFAVLETAFDQMSQVSSSKFQVSGSEPQRLAAESQTPNLAQPLTWNSPLPGRLTPALAALEAVCQELGGESLAGLVERCGEEAEPDIASGLAYDAYRFELPYTHNAKLVLPYRAATALLRSLSNPANPPYAVRRADGSCYLEIFEVRTHLVDSLQNKTLVVLDSTMPPQLARLLPNLQEICYSVPQHLEVTQITNALYSKQNLYNPATRELVGEAIAAFAWEGEKAEGTRYKEEGRKGEELNSPHPSSLIPHPFPSPLLSILPMRFESGPEAIPVPSGSRVEHWGLHRATNQYSDCDALALVGHHLRPLDRIEAEVRAIKAAGSRHKDEGGGKEEERDYSIQNQLSPQEGKSAVPAGGKIQNRRLRLYNHLSAEGRATGRWMETSADPEVQAAIEHDYYAHIIQAIGRLRAALRPAHLPPVRVLILCNEPVGDLKVDHLTTAKRLIAEQAAGSRQQAADTLGVVDKLSGASSSASFIPHPSSFETTDPPKMENFISNIYMKSPEKGYMVVDTTGRVQSGELVLTELLSGLMAQNLGWDNDMVQDETVETQLWEAAELALDALLLDHDAPDPWDEPVERQEE